MMNEEREALRCEINELRKRLDETVAKCAALQLENGDLKDQLSRTQSANEILSSKLEIVYLIFGGER